MPYVTVDVDVDLDQFDDDELAEELESRGYFVSKDTRFDEPDALDKYEVEYLLDLVDKSEKKYYTHYTLREKLNNLRWG